MTNPKQNVLGRLRHMILSGELASGQRLAEIPTAEQLGVSRTPIRIAFRSLAQEGLLTKRDGRGYSVRRVTKEDINGAIEVRGALEGLAAKQASEKTLTQEQHEELKNLLNEGDGLFVKGSVNADDLEAYQKMNQRFHQIIIEASQNPAIAEALKHNEHLPFASVNALAFNDKKLAEEYRRFYFAHMQHHVIYDAISQGQSSRAESIMREHANVTIRYAKNFSELEEKGEKLQLINSANNVRI